MILMSDISGIFMFLFDVYSAVVIRLNNNLTISSNQGGAIL